MGVALRIITPPVALLAMLLALPGELYCQVGLASRVARVSLSARVPPHASMQQVGLPRDTGRQGPLRETRVTISMTGNVGYRVTVHGTGPTTSSGGPTDHIWVLGADGRFHELGRGTGVTVVQVQAAGESQREIVYRIEDSPDSGSTHPLPVRYDVAVDPVL